MPRSLVLGHRGAPRYCPENTLVSFEKALELGADGLELDVQLTKDDELVVIHDERIDRTTRDETGLVRDYTLAQLRRMDFGGWFSPGFAGTRIPTLADVLDLLERRTDGNPDRLHLDIELKTGLVPYPGIEEKVLQLVADRSYTNFQISSFYHQTLVNAREVDPDVRIGVLYVSGLYEPWRYGERLGAFSLNPNFTSLNPEFVKPPRILPMEDDGACDDGAMRWFPWTVDRERDLRTMFEIGVTGLISNRCDVALAVRDEVQ